VSDEIEVVIDSLGARGDGIARAADGAQVFVAGALAGERVRVRPLAEKGRAALAAVLEPSSGRVSPPCPHFLDCGGCAAQHMGDVIYENWKRGLIADALARAGVAANVGPVFRVPAASRRRARFFAARVGKGAVVGFQAAASHRIVDMTACPALEPALFALVAPLRDFFAAALAPGARGEAEAQVIGGALDVVMRLPRPLDRELNDKLLRLAGESGMARIGWQRLRKGRGAGGEVEPVAQFSPVQASFGGFKVALPPLAFVQASSAGEAALVAAVLARVEPGAHVADLYAGAGTFTLPLTAKARRIAAFDGVRDLVAALEQGARSGGVGERVAATARDLERRPLMASELDAFDTVVFDPPRGGAEAQTRQIAASKVGKVVAVSCNPISFARDAKILIDGGFEIGPVMPVDQFVWTRHLEMVAAFARAG
jgi:23S rRNA (uracil1939-C5)-methyltransferase